MKFKLINEPSEELFNIFKSYCLKSKPFDFCELPSMQMRIFKIREYFNNLFENCEIYIAEENGKILGFGGFRQEGDSVSADFVVGFNNFTHIKEIANCNFLKLPFPTDDLFCDDEKFIDPRYWKN